MKNQAITLMEVCGTHTMAIARLGIKSLIPDDIRLISGPGCPVCVTSQADIDRAIAIAKLKDVIITTFGDMMRVPGSKGSLAEVKRKGADVRVVYSCLDSIKIAWDNPDKKIVFVGVGFETTSPTIAATIIEAKKQKVKNFFVLPFFKLIFPALEVLSKSKSVKVDGYICPGHVSVITGSIPYEKVAIRYKKPCVIMGFDANDLVKGINLLVKKIKNKDYTVEIAYKRVVKREGNKEARRVLNSVFEADDAMWRGIGVIKRSGLKFRKKYCEFDALKEFKVKAPKPKETKGCLCGQVLQGTKTPRDCKLFKKACSPRHPIGPCMVSSEGTCAAFYHYSDASPNK